MHACTSTRMGEHQKHGKPLFKDKRELSAAVSYMIESGTLIILITFPVLKDAYAKNYLITSTLLLKLSNTVQILFI